MSDRDEGLRDDGERAVRRVLAATDFSDPAGVAVAAAAELAKRHGAVLHLVHAVPVLPLASGDLGIPVEAIDAYTAGAAATLDDEAARWRASGLEVEREVELGAPAGVVLAAAERTAADVVVLGTRGHTGLRFLLLGSTTRKVVQRAPCPVLTLRAQGGHDLGGGTILVPTMLAGDADAAIAAALRVLGPLRDAARVVLFHAVDVPPELAIYGSVARFEADRDATEAAARERIEETAAAWSGRGPRVETRLGRGFPTESIVEAAEACEASAIAMVTHGTRGLEHAVLGSVAERVVQLAPCPVLTVRRA